MQIKIEKSKYAVKDDQEYFWICCQAIFFRAELIFLTAWYVFTYYLKQKQYQEIY